MKNEGPYILEWLAYHRALGIDRFYIADNNSDDGLTEILAALSAAGMVDFFPFPHLPGEAPQLPAYSEILRRHSLDADWIIFIDADEFLVPTDGARSLNPFFERMNSDPGIGAVVLNWATYGSSGHEAGSADPVIERFAKRGEREWIINNHYKSAVRTAASPRARRTPHLLGIHKNFRTVQSDGTSLKNHPQLGEGLSEIIVWSHVRINHYVIKSRSEFFENKSPKGSATLATRRKGLDYFTSHDRNVVADPMPGWLVAATRNELEILKSLVV